MPVLMRDQTLLALRQIGATAEYLFEQDAVQEFCRNASCNWVLYVPDLGYCQTMIVFGKFDVGKLDAGKFDFGIFYCERKENK